MFILFGILYSIVYYWQTFYNSYYYNATALHLRPHSFTCPIHNLHLVCVGLKTVLQKLASADVLCMLCHTYANNHINYFTTDTASLMVTSQPMLLVVVSRWRWFPVAISPKTSSSRCGWWLQKLSPKGPYFFFFLV